MKLFIASVLTLIGLSAQAVTPAEVTALIPAGFDLAKTYQLLIDATDNSNVIDASYVIYDFNKDGIDDIAMVVEKTFLNTENPDFSKYTADSRKLLIFLGQANGTHVKAGEKGGDLMLNVGDGGVAAYYSDPFDGLSVNKQGSLVISYWGGSSMKWGYEFKIQYRTVKGKADFYLVGKTQFYQDWDTKSDESGMLTTTIDTNLLTGKSITTVTKESENGEDVVSKKTKHAKTKLVSLDAITDADTFGFEGE